MDLGLAPVPEADTCRSQLVEPPKRGPGRACSRRAGSNTKPPFEHGDEALGGAFQLGKTPQSRTQLAQHLRNVRRIDPSELKTSEELIQAVHRDEAFDARFQRLLGEQFGCGLRV